MEKGITFFDRIASWQDRTACLMGIIACAFFLATGASAQNIKVNATLDTQQILIGDQINLDISVDFEGAQTVLWPVFKDTITGQLEVVTASIPDTLKNETGETIIHQRLVITSFDTGFIQLPSMTFIFNDDSSQAFSTQPLLIFVSDIPVVMEEDIKEIKEPYDVPFNWKKWLKWGLIILLLLAALVGAILLWKRNRKQEPMVMARPKPKRPAHEIALEKLEELRRKKLWQNNQTKEFYIELSDIVREYIEFQFDILALEMTTDETVSALRMKGLDESKILPLMKTLQMADLAKFAKYTPMANENELCFENARTFVSSTLVMPLDEPKPDQPE